METGDDDSGIVLVLTLLPLLAVPPAFKALALVLRGANSMVNKKKTSRKYHLIIVNHVHL